MSSIVFLPTPPKSPQPEDQLPCNPASQNPIIFQAFEWHSTADHKHWQRLERALPSLAAIGVTHLWLPPGSKARDAQSNGYDIYDAYDLGEFDQKGTVPTKWGTKDDLISLATACKRERVGLIWDAILNHRAFADSTEDVQVVEVNPRDRTKDITEPLTISAWTRFDFPGRNSTYSSFTYNKSHFNGTDWDQNTQKRAIYRFIEDGKDWAQDVSKLQGNADYLMLENIDYTNPEVVSETINWGKWIVKALDLAGFRLDAVQHYSWRFADRWCEELRKEKGVDLLCVGEFWNGDVNVLQDWLANMSPEFRLYDVPLMYRLARLSWGEDGDLRRVFEDTLVQRMPRNAVTFIRIHDTQKGQDMDTPICEGFMPHAYSLLLLRRDGIPCVFFGDMYGIAGPYPEAPTCFGRLPDLMLARQLYAHGPQVDYFERKDCIGWTRQGDLDNSNGYAIILSWNWDVVSNECPPLIAMSVGRQHAGETWTDILGFEKDAVEIDRDGVGRFVCERNSMACYTNEAAIGRERFPVNFVGGF
ncbi:alpha amylase [Paraphoma chrysanthemicola]|uniref:Alpha amylase n=1 Tax=Paraphoma chrysanthemicola TaxID=798071 RepID=A0A8K0W484_9PLEO|nr:alpha amylase [Paraphoma chrysanthemicola]